MGRETTPGSVYDRVRDLTERADPVLKPMKVTRVNVWVANEVVVNVRGKNYWLLNMMDSGSRFVLAAYLSPALTAWAARQC